jgi:hypothetical protein
MTVSTAARRLLAPSVAVLAALLLALIGAASASAQGAPKPTNPSGFIRLGHLAPDVGPVDVYLAPFGGQAQSVIQKAPYGTLTKYQTLAPGDYTVAMRPAGTPTTTAPMLSTQVSVAQGAASTVLATSRMGSLTTSVIADDLTPPAADSSRVRLVQGSPAAQRLTVQAAGGPTLARDVAYGTATGYADVQQGRWTLQVTAADGSNAMASAPQVDLAAGSVNSLLVTDAPGGGFAITAVVDAAGIDTAMAPAGGVPTGAGGTATDVVGTPGAHPGLGLGLAAVLVVLVGGAAAARRKTVAVRA